MIHGPDLGSCRELLVAHSASSRTPVLEPELTLRGLLLPGVLIGKGAGCGGSSERLSNQSIILYGMQSAEGDNAVGGTRM